VLIVKEEVIVSNKLGVFMEFFFTVAEVNKLLPELRRLLLNALEEKQRMVSMMPQVLKAKEGHIFDWGTPNGPVYIQILDSFYKTAQDIENLGVIVKDFDQGLCDFPHQREGRIVYLCWKLDEEEVGWWHEVDSGFAGRQPV
jgi:hypothetical protein